MNLIQQYQYNRFVQRDLWREARLRNQPGTVSRILSGILGSFPGKPIPEPRTALVSTAERAVVVDLSSYQPSADIESMIEAGVTHFFLRMLYVGRYEMDHWNLTEDPTYRSYYTRIRAYAKSKGKAVWIGGYVVYCAGVEVQDYVNTHIFTDAMAEIMGADYRPDVLWLDDEVDHWWENNKDTYAGAVNQVKGVRELRRKSWERFHIVTGYYSGRWFVDRYKDQYTYWMDVVNAPTPQGKTMPIWMAWYPVKFSGILSSFAAALGLLPIPTATQKINLLDGPGSFSSCDCWQFTGSLVTPWNKNALGQPAGIDCSCSLESIRNFNTSLGIADTPTVPPPAPDGGGETDLDGIRLRLAIVEDKLADMGEVLR